MNRIQKIAVIQLLAADYHSGQGSRGYRLQCRASRWLKRRGLIPGACLFVRSETVKEVQAKSALYHDLAARYGNKL